MLLQPEINRQTPAAPIAPRVHAQRFLTISINPRFEACSKEHEEEKIWLLLRKQFRSTRM